jgi:hypothetical protein
MHFTINTYSIISSTTTLTDACSTCDLDLDVVRQKLPKLLDGFRGVFSSYVRCHSRGSEDRDQLPRVAFSLLALSLQVPLLVAAPADSTRSLLCTMPHCTVLVVCQLRISRCTGHTTVPSPGRLRCTTLIQ